MAIAGLLAVGLAAALLLQGSPVSDRGPVAVSYPAGEVKEVRVLDAVDVYVDGEPRPGFSVFGGMALLMLATAGLMTLVALRFAGARRHLRLFWGIAAAGLAVAGTDELLAIHESVGHNLRFLADLPGVKRPDDVLLALYLPAALAFGWWFRDVLREHSLTVACGAAGIFFFGLSVAGDLASLQHRGVVRAGGRAVLRRGTDQPDVPPPEGQPRHPGERAGAGCEASSRRAGIRAGASARAESIAPHEPRTAVGKAGQLLGIGATLAARRPGCPGDVGRPEAGYGASSAEVPRRAAPGWSTNPPASAAS